MRSVYDEAECPRDATRLREQIAGPGRFFVCERCDGVWVSATDLRAFLDSPNEFWKLPDSDLSRQQVVDLPRLPSDSARCPCSGELEAKRKRGVRIDVCPQCRAVWLDGGELARLVARHDKEKEGLARAVLYLVAGFLPLEDLF